MLEAIVILCPLLLSPGDHSNSKSLRDVDSTALAISIGITLSADYFLQLALHEGSHALTAKYYGATIESISILPSRDPIDNSWRLGYTEYSYTLGSISNREHANILLAPISIDLLILSTYSVLSVGNLWNKSDFNKLGISIFAAGAALDLAKTSLDWRRTSDLRKAARLLDWNRDQIRAARLTLGAVSLLCLGEILWNVISIFSNKKSALVSSRFKLLPTVLDTEIGITIKVLF